MSDWFYSDYTGAIFSGVGDTIKKALVLLSVPVFGHFVGCNCYEAPDLISQLWAGGLAGLSSINLASSGMELVVMPLSWIGTMFLCLTHLPTLPYPFLLLYAWFKIWLDDDDWWHGVAIILVAQPLTTGYLMCAEDNSMSGGSFVFSGVILGIYEAAAIAAIIWYARQRESVE